MKMKNLTLTFLALILLKSFMVGKIEGMENLTENKMDTLKNLSFQDSLFFEKKALLEEEINSSNLCQFAFDNFTLEVQVEDSSATAALYSKKIQSNLMQEFEIYIKGICTLEIRCEEERLGACLNSNSDPKTIIRYFKNKDETLNFLQLLEKNDSKYQSYIMEIKKQYEELLKNTEIEYKRGQEKAIEKIIAFYRDIRKSIINIETFEWDDSDDEGEFNQSLINFFDIYQWDNFKSFEISLGSNKQIKRILVNFNNLDETFLFLVKLGRLEFLGASIRQKIIEIMGLVKDSGKQSLVM